VHVTKYIVEESKYKQIKRKLEVLHHMSPQEHGLKYAFPFMEKTNSGKFFEDENTANCAIFPKLLGVAVPEESGNMRTFMPRMHEVRTKQKKSLWSIVADRVLHPERYEENQDKVKNKTLEKVEAEEQLRESSKGLTGGEMNEAINEQRKATAEEEEIEETGRNEKEKKKETEKERGTHTHVRAKQKIMEDLNRRVFDTLLAQLNLLSNSQDRPISPSSLTDDVLMDPLAVYSEAVENPI